MGIDGYIDDKFRQDILEFLGKNYGFDIIAIILFDSYGTRKACYKL